MDNSLANTDNILSVAKNGGDLGIMLTKGAQMFFNELFKRGTTQEKLEKHVEESPQFGLYIGKAFVSTLNETTKEKIDLWAKIIFDLHLGKKALEFPDSELFFKFLGDSTLQDLTVLSYTYTQIPQEETDFQKALENRLEGSLTPQQVKNSLVRLASFGLLNTSYDQTGFYGDGKPLLAPLVCTRNETGKAFLEFIGDWHTKAGQKRK